jgi:hypothetical protein
MPTFLYLDYGPSRYIAREVRYSLSTLLAEYSGGGAKVVVSTDKPQVYEALDPCVSVKDISSDVGAMTRDGALGHRAKACVLLDALRTESDDCVLLDTDSYIAPGFAAGLTKAVAAGAAMDAFEETNPYPEIVGFQAELPHFGRYVYDPVRSVMHNSGLVAANPARHLAVFEDVMALIDALLDRGYRSFKIEQISISECFRLHSVPVSDMRPLFQHYFRRSLKRYMHWRLDRWIKREPVFKPGRPFIDPSRNEVRVFNYVNQLTRRY